MGKGTFFLKSLTTMRKIEKMLLVEQLSSSSPNKMARTLCSNGLQYPYGALCQKKKTVAQRLGADLAWIFAISNSSYKQFHCGDTWQLGSFTTSLALRILVLCRVRGSYGKVTSLGHNDVVLLE